MSELAPEDQILSFLALLALLSKFWKYIYMEKTY